jgi:hypothetical protein
VTPFCIALPIAQEIKASIDIWDCIILKASTQQRKQLPESRDNLQNGRKSLPAIHQIKDQHPEYIKSSRS